MDLLNVLASDRRNASAHSTHSSLREQIIGHLFLGELLAHLWRLGRYDVEVLKGEVDCHGYDVVVELDGVLRHVQLKSRFSGSNTASVDIGVKLQRKPSGCVIWIEFDPDTMKLQRFYWYGGIAGAPLPMLGERTSKHSKGDGKGTKHERPLYREVSKRAFEPLNSMSEVVDRLFG